MGGSMEESWLIFFSKYLWKNDFNDLSSFLDEASSLQKWQENHLQQFMAFFFRTSNWMLSLGKCSYHKKVPRNQKPGSWLFMATPRDPIRPGDCPRLHHGHDSSRSNYEPSSLWYEHDTQQQLWSWCYWNACEKKDKDDENNSFYRDGKGNNGDCDHENNSDNDNYDENTNDMIIEFNW